MSEIKKFGKMVVVGEYISLPSFFPTFLGSKRNPEYTQLRNILSYGRDSEYKEIVSMYVVNIDIKSNKYFVHYTNVFSLLKALNYKITDKSVVLNFSNAVRYIEDQARIKKQTKEIYDAVKNPQRGEYNDWYY